MALLLQVTITPATREQFNQLDTRVGQSMTQAGARLRASGPTSCIRTAKASLLLTSGAQSPRE